MVEKEINFLASKLKKMRKDAGLTQAEFGKIVGYSAGYVSATENGRYGDPAFLIKLFEAHQSGAKRLDQMTAVQIERFFEAINEEKTISFTVRKEDYDFIYQYAQMKGVSMNDLIREAIVVFFEHEYKNRKLKERENNGN